MKYWWIFFLVVVFVGCATETPDQPDGQAHMLPTRTPTSQVPLPKPTEPVSPVSPLSPLPFPNLPEGMQKEALMTLRTEVAETTGVLTADLALVSAEPVTWNNTSLGCPKKGQIYAEVLVEGWRVVFEDAAGRTYDVHTTGNLEDFVICSTSEADLEEEDISEGLTISQVKKAAVQALVEYLDVEQDQISVVHIEEVQWSDACLGCAKPGQMCAMVITPGYRVILESEGETYPVHTDLSGQHVIVCERASETPKP